MEGKFRRSSNEFCLAFVNLDLLEFHLGKFVVFHEKEDTSPGKSRMINFAVNYGIQTRRLYRKKKMNKRSVS